MADESYRSFSFEFYKKFVEKYKDEYHILSIQSSLQVGQNHVPQFQMMNTFLAMNPDIRKLIACIPYVDLIVSCDSFIPHASEALGTPVPTVVLWGGTSPKNLGYSDHINVVTKKKVIHEPNRIIHNHAIYLNNNKGCNEFDIEEVASVIPSTSAKTETCCGKCSDDCFDYSKFIEREGALNAVKS
jgi:ADP-heptose:LPS heptosyltransferase